MDQGIGGFDERVIFIVGETKLLAGQVAEKDFRARGDLLLKFGEVHVQLQRLPEAFAGFLLGFCAYQ